MRDDRSPVPSNKCMNIQFTFTAFLMAAALLAGGCSTRPAHVAGASSESIVIEPGVAVGPVHSGMTIQQVIAELGQPERTKYSALEYTNLGIYISPGKSEVVHIVGIFPPFAGRTKEGIGLGSSRADIIQAYGEPTAAKPIKPGFEVLRYDPPGLNFELRDGKVDSIGMIFQTTK